MDLFEKIYKVFGQDTPSRLLYNATVASPTNTAVIIKQYKNWQNLKKPTLCFVVLNVKQHLQLQNLWYQLLLKLRLGQRKNELQH